MKKIFINYSWQHDSKNAERLYSRLSEFNEFNVWMDKENMQGGLQWRPAIRKAIRESDFFVSVLSSNSILGRGERNKEIYEALDVLKEFPPGEVYLIPARLDECSPPFEEMKNLNWINFFPNWNDGFNNLLKAIGITKPQKKIIKAEDKEISGRKYHYRVGLVDLDMGLTNINEIAAQLNKVQNYFLFTLPDMPALNRSSKVIEGIKCFTVYNVPHSYIEEHRHLAVDLIACITKYPLAFVEDDKLLYNYFAGSSDQDERFLFLSADNLYEYCKEANCTFEEGLVYMLVGQLLVYFTELRYHTQTRGCVMDFCGNRDDMIFGLKSRSFCKYCLKKLPEGELKNSLLKLLNWKYK